MPSQSAIDEVAAQDLTPRQFWLEYVSQRKPVLIHGHLQQAEWKATRKWTKNEYLLDKACMAEVDVEWRDEGGSFGQGKKKKMRFADFLERLVAGDQNLYLSTQIERKAPDGHPEFLSHLLLCLCKDYPFRPALIGGLMPYQVNLWMGAAPAGASSGLHHDYHDNLYILLRGRKRFRLFPPALARRMYPQGTISKIHPNGRIVYEGQGNVAADGSRPAAARRALRMEIEDRIDKTTQAMQATDSAMARCRGHPDPALDRRWQRLQAKLEAQEAELDAFLADALDGGSDAEEDDDDYGASGEGEPWEDCLEERERLKRDPEPDPEPDSFSRVDIGASAAEVARRFPDFPGAAAALTVEVKAGEMLYLPAGWFHEVTSYGDQHMAFNYWMHPPDNLSKQGFLKPYTRDFWPTHFRQRFGGDHETKV